MAQGKPSVVQNIGGEHHKVVGGNIIHGDAHFHIHGDTTSSKKDGKEEKMTSARKRNLFDKICTYRGEIDALSSRFYPLV